jgi:uncharacterized membrane protein YjgN (DUF898 family)
VVTLGIYSAWAKVRRLQYFYGNTYLDGVPFAYHAAPVTILKGRILAVATIGVIATVGYVAPLAGQLLYLALACASPWLIVKGLQFRNRNTSHRGIRFDFDGSPGEAYPAFFWQPALVPLTLGLAFPYVLAKQREFVADNSRYGSSRFLLTAPTSAFYRLFGRTLLFFVGLVAAVFVSTIASEIGLAAWMQKHRHQPLL